MVWTNKYGTITPDFKSHVKNFWLSYYWLLNIIDILQNWSKLCWWYPPFTSQTLSQECVGKRLIISTLVVTDDKDAGGSSYHSQLACLPTENIFEARKIPLQELPSASLCQDFHSIWPSRPFNVWGCWMLPKGLVYLCVCVFVCDNEVGVLVLQALGAVHELLGVRRLPLFSRL